MRALFFSVSIGFMLSLGSCVHDPITPMEHNPAEINLLWNASYPDEKMEDAILGLYWCLSHIGAKNTNSTSSGIEVKSTLITLNTNAIGLSKNAQNSINSLHSKIQKSPAYIQNNAIDLGRYITLLIGASEHYYRITDVPESLQNQLANYTLVSEKGYVNNSIISDHHRIIQYTQPAGLKQLFISVEIDSNTQEILEFETMELMDNGQFKFAIFDADSQRIPAAIKQGSNAGKPAKCMWCHESSINPLFRIQNDYAGFLTFLELQDTLISLQDELELKQSFLANGVDFSQKQQHAQMELQYLMFKQPSPMRLANEWNMSVTDVRQLLATEQLYSNPEFPFLGDGYDRNQMEAYAPFNGLLTSSNVRESSPIEVNYID